MIQTGTILDSKYRVLRLLGAAGFGEVYLADDELAGRQVAIKVLHERNAQARDNLVHEMRSLDHLHDPNIVAFYHYFTQDEDTLLLVMEFCGGGSLRDRMRQCPIRVQTAMEWGRALAGVLYRVHQHDVVHHDNNILFTSEGVLKVGDFGVANRNIGTFWYVPPEMHLGNIDPKDVRVDVYALGVTLLEILCNRSPFQEMSRNEVLRSKLRHDFIPQDLAPWIQDLISKATHPTPELRFQSMQDFREAIESQHVSYAFDQNRVKAHALASKAERLLARKRPTAASKHIRQALHVCPDCVSALVAAGRYSLFVNNLAEAKKNFDQALLVNPRVNIQKELGWLSLETGNYSQALSLLTDHLQRNAADYEAFNLLLECFYRTERYETGAQIAKLMMDERAPSDCFLNNGFLCLMLEAGADQDAVRAAIGTGSMKNPFLAYNMRVLQNTEPDRQRPLALFHNYRFGPTSKRQNSLTVAIDGDERQLTEPIITVGRAPENRVQLSDTNVSRNHCVIVNLPDDVWIYDLNSTQGVFVDGARIHRKAYLEGVHVVSVGRTDLTVCSKVGLLA